MSKVMIILGAALFIMTGFSFAETPIEKGGIILEGQISMMSQSGELHENYEGDGLTTVVLNPSMGFFVTDGLLLGANFSLLSISQGDNSYSELLVGPKIAYYINTNKNRPEAKGAAYPYVGAFFNFGSID
ncbi:MAG: hypothetical protein ABIE07_01790 [Candidatus Zixiibacteriota bacterium]